MSEDQKNKDGNASAQSGVVSGDAPAIAAAGQGKPAKASKRAKPAAAPEQAASAAKPGRAPRRKVRPRARRWPAVLAGSTTAALAVVAVAAGSALPGFDATATVKPRTEVLPVGVTLANCPGPTQLLSGSAAGTDPQFSPNSSSTKTVLNALALSDANGVVPGTSVSSLGSNAKELFSVSPTPTAPPASPGASAPATLAPLTGEAKAKAAVVRDEAMGTPSVLKALPFAGQRARSAGSVVVTAADGDLRGLAAATCQTPSNDFWLTGASTTVGRTAVLTLANSTQSSATVSLDLFGASGPIQAPGGKSLVIAPGAVQSVVLSGLAPDQQQLSVHVRSVGGAVSGTIQQSVLRGLTPGGVDFLQPVEGPAASTVIPGVQVQDPAAAAKISAQDGYSDASTTLQVTVPGATDAVVAVKAYGPSGQAALPGGGVFTAPAGKVSSLPLAGLPQGTYSLSVTSDSAVVAGVRLANSTKPGSAVDLALAPSGSRLGVNHLATLPGGVASSFAFTAPTGAATITMVPVSATGVLGSARTINLRAGVTTVVDPAALLGKDAVAALVSAAGEPAYGTQLLGTKGSANIAVLPFAGTGAESHTLAISTGY
ncbi:DUF5719 family protein [Arthrobacter sp. SDTb3-6]|uniref:DUF5719 family protein n=1 Tax=Arthrobacter sp. SDTb3-6 TaxID=2713571 RepID=UPI00159E6FFA|nr:hypothetical protein [Arthrobacter sp. SDTb3-6]